MCESFVRSTTSLSENLTMYRSRTSMVANPEHDFPAAPSLDEEACSSVQVSEESDTILKISEVKYGKSQVRNGNGHQVSLQLL
mmetsp:Transcript_109778/g.173441  ORF Transcript_109778/g.173441 Transcript_109778/m.173441 type:complete len:83 (+) Transcript_109778:1-249(+)